MTRFTDRFTIIALLVTATLPFAAFTPVQAASAASCTVQAEQMRTLAQDADPKAAAKALRVVAVAEQICAEGGRVEASKKFAQAAKLLDASVQMADRR